MKRKFLIMSAVLLTICGAALLQSCSSEYEYYDATEEYGYYTEEEIEAIEAMAEKYGISIEIDRNYYGEKQTLEEIELELMELATIRGEYEIVPQKDSEGNIIYTSRKTERNSRTLTRAAEGSWSGSDNTKKYTVDVTVCWDLNKAFQYERLYAKAKLAKNYTSSTPKTISSNFIGDNNIEFYGSVSETFFGNIYSIEIYDGIIYNYPENGPGYFKVR